MYLDLISTYSVEFVGKLHSVVVLPGHPVFAWLPILQFLNLWEE